jgi:cell division protein FtsN
MSREKNTRSESQGKVARGGTLVGIFVGLIIGAVLAAIVAVYFSRPFPFQQSQQRPAETRPIAAAPVPAPATAPAAPPVAGTTTPATPPAPVADNQPLALPGKPGDKPLEKPRLDFYKTLPEGQPVKPVAEAGTTEAPVKERLYLQVGAFENPSDADNMKARVTLLGFEPSIQRIELANKPPIHRVRVGPYTKMEDLTPVRATLSQAGIANSVARDK